MSDPAAAAPAPPVDAPPPRKGRVGKWILRIGLGLVALLVLSFLFRNAIARSAAEETVTRVTGFPLEIGSVDLGLFDSRVEIRDLHLRNPEGFEDPRCIHVPRIVAQVEASSAFSKRFHAKEIILDVAEVVVVTNAKGEMNLDRLAALGEGDKDKKDEAGKEKEEATELLWKCDVLKLSLGKVVILDYSRGRGGKPRKDVFDLGVKKEFHDLTSPDQVVRALLYEVVTGTPVKLLKMSADKLLDGIGDVVGGVGGAVKGVVEGVGDALGGFLGLDKKPEEPKKKP